MHCWMCVEMYLNLHIIVFLALQICVDSSPYFNTTNDKTNKLYLRIRGGNLPNAQCQVALRKLRTFPFDQGTYPIFCSGTILSDMKVLTAAHCVYRKRTFVERFRCLPVSRLKMVTKNMYVVAGDRSAAMHYPMKGSAEQWRRIKKIVAPHDYSFPRNDISLVFLQKPLIFNKMIFSIPYPLDKSDFIDYDYPFSRCVVIGHGEGRLKLKAVTILSNAECSKKHSKNMTRFICPVMKNDVWEKGDDGGIITCSFTRHKVRNITEQEKLAGFHFEYKEVALGIACTKTPHGPLYTRVSEYADFINTNKASKGPIGNCAMFHIVLINFIFHVMCFTLF